MPTPSPIRIQTPDLAFTGPLQQQFSAYQATNPSDGLRLSVVPAEPAADSLLNDARMELGQFAAAFSVTSSIPDLVRDNFIRPASPPPRPLPRAIAQLRSFGGEWVATDFAHDCTLLVLRADFMPPDEQIPETWSALLELAHSTGRSLTVPQTNAQQVADHFCSMAASLVGTEDFWFAPATMAPAIASQAHQQALALWKAMSQTNPSVARWDSTGALWESFIEGDSIALIASARFVPYAIQRASEPQRFVVAPLPGSEQPSGAIQCAGNATGANWGGVVMAGSAGAQIASGFLDDVAQPETQRALITDLASSLIPAGASPDDDIDAFMAAGWPQDPTAAWVEAISSTFNNPLQLVPLRIAEVQRYLRSLESRIVDFLSENGASAAEALEAASSDWSAINDAIGVDTQRDLFRRSLMSAPDQ